MFFDDIFVEDEDKQITYFTDGLGQALLATAISYTPYDTGNLAHSIRLTANHQNLKKINYPAQDAFYTEFLEEGTSVHGQHEGFISEQTVPAIALQVSNYFRDPRQYKYGRLYNRGTALRNRAYRSGVRGEQEYKIGRSNFSGVTRKQRREASRMMYNKYIQGK